MNVYTAFRVLRGAANIAFIDTDFSDFSSNTYGLRFVFELDETIGGGN
jgi:hypothetical protein